MTGSEGSDGEFRVAAVILGVSGVAFVAAIRAVCGALRERELNTGCQFTDEEREAILTVASALPGLEERLSVTEASLQAMIERLDTLIARSNRTRSSDRAR